MNIAVVLTVDGLTTHEGQGGRPAGDPLVPAVALVSLMRLGRGAAGQVVTTGSFTGMRPSRVGEVARAILNGLGSTELRFVHCAAPGPCEIARHQFAAYYALSRRAVPCARKGTKRFAMPDERKTPAASAIPTVQVISEMAGVSKSTVSRALADDKGIAVKTKRRIFAIAEGLGYMPNAMARGLTTQRSGVIGFVSTNFDHYFYQEAFDKLGRVAAEHRKQVMLFQIPDGGDVRHVVPTMAQYRLDGCIILAATPVSAESLLVCQRYRMPVVLLNRVIPGSQACSVLCDHVSAAQEIAELLLEAGHQRIAILAGRPNNTVSQDRETGFLRGLADAGRSVYKRVVGQSEFAPAFEAVKDLISTGVIPDAIFAVNDIMAYGAIDALRQAKLRVPSDVSIIGFDNGRAGGWPAYNLTTYSQPIEQMFRRAVELIEARAAREAQPESIYIRGDLVIRGSARLPARLMATVA